MKGKTKAQKGITLIALIITIVVLLILAAVAINSITGDGILGQAQDAATKYNQAVKDEGEMLDYYELVLAGLAWTQNGTTVTRNGQTLKVGQVVENYTAEGDNAWQILGVEEGKLLLVTQNAKDNLQLSGRDGYINGIQEINDTCAKYVDNNFANSARSIELDDINRITGYDPTKYGEGSIWAWGNEASYKMENGVVTVYGSKNGVGNGASTQTSFTTINGKILGNDGVLSDTVKANYAPYLISKDAYDLSDEVRNMIYGEAALGNNIGKGYWLATRYSYPNTGRAVYGMYRVAINVDKNETEGRVWSKMLYSTEGENGTSESHYTFVRPVAIINPDVVLTETSEGSGVWKLSK